MPVSHALCRAGSAHAWLPVLSWMRSRHAVRNPLPGTASNSRNVSSPGTFPHLTASAINLTAYLLVLFAFRLSKVGYVVAGRELSIVFSTLIGSLWMNEGRLLPRLAGAAVVLAGVVCVALAP